MNGTSLVSGLPPEEFPARIQWARFRHDGVFWRRLAYRGATGAPEWFRRAAPPVIAAAIFLAVGRNRRAVRGNLRDVLGSRWVGREILDTYSVFREFAHTVAETLEQHGPDPRPIHLDAPYGEEIQALSESGRGLLIVTSHFGSWEVAARVLQGFDRPVNLVMARESNPTVEAFQTQTRQGRGLTILHSDKSVFSTVPMVRALRRGEIVAMQMDRTAPGQATRTLRFLGSDARFAYGPFAIARAAEVPILPVFAVRLGRRSYRILPEVARRLSRRADEAETLAVMQDVASSLERHVRAYPWQWFQFSRFCQSE